MDLLNPDNSMDFSEMVTSFHSVYAVENMAYHSLPQAYYDTPRSWDIFSNDLAVLMVN